MRTVPTLVASGAGISLGSVGLTLARPDDSHARRRNDMTTVASTYTLLTPETRPIDFDFNSDRSFSTPHTTRLARWEDDGGTQPSSSTRLNRSVSQHTNLGMGTERPIKRDEDTLSQAGTPVGRPRSWLRRLSSSMSTSRDSSRTPTSRPGSAAVSNSNGSVALSHSGSTTPMFSVETPPPTKPNKLVKRTSSLRSTNGSPFQGSGSRLPLPNFRRPATSHQRSATVQETLSGTDSSDRASTRTRSDDAHDPRWRHFFTPRVAQDEPSFGRRRSSTGIPNPIKRIYPDRKYTPVLVSGGEMVKPAEIEMDDGLSMDEESLATTKLTMAPTIASSPLPIQPSQFGGSSIPRRSFSIGDLLATGPQPLQKRPTSSSSRTSFSKLIRKGRSRVTSAPQASMGSSFSSPAGQTAERPAKRREVTDPQAGHLSIYSSSSSTQPAEYQHQEIQLNLGSSTPPSQRFNFSDSPLFEPTFQAGTSSPSEARRLPSGKADPIDIRPARVSAAHSEVAASTIGSESERRSLGGYSTDYQSDTVFDSLPTRTTRSSSGKRGPPIDTIFDESPPSFSSGRSTKLHDLLNDGYFPGSEHSTRYRHSTIEEEESVISTPVRSLHDKSVTSTPSARPGAQQMFSSSPPAIAVRPQMADFDEIDWDMPDEVPARQGDLGIQHEPSTPAKAQPGPKLLPFRFNAFNRAANVTSAHSTPNRYINGGTDKANPFDWSEQQPSPSHHNQSPPRPRTVHGKKDNENRGSRAVGRRAPSGMHARSHSVPVVPDVDGKRSVTANKFGTWGVGSKAVTEDWNEDFDFEEEAVPPMPDFSNALLDEKRIDSGHEMFVPKSIREQQENVVANIGLLREWGLLIEELKDLRIRAVALDMMSGPHAKAWQEVDAMIELADQESQEDMLQPRRSPPSSPGFDYDAFDEPDTVSFGANGSQDSSARHSVFMEDDEVGQLASQVSPVHSAGVHGIMTRPRKDSEAVARSVIEALQSKRSVSDPTALHPVTPAKKVPFDTATLRHIVPYVNGLKRKVKDALRETEGLYSSPRRRSPPDDDQDDQRYSHDEPAFRSIFNEPGPDSPTARRRSRREEAATDNDGWDVPMTDSPITLAARIERMTLKPS